MISISHRCMITTVYCFGRMPGLQNPCYRTCLWHLNGNGFLTLVRRPFFLCDTTHGMYTAMEFPLPWRCITVLSHDLFYWLHVYWLLSVIETFNWSFLTTVENIMFYFFHNILFSLFIFYILKWLITMTFQNLYTEVRFLILIIFPE